MADGVAAVVDRPASEADDEAEESALSLLVPLDVFVGGWNASELEVGGAHRGPVVDTTEKLGCEAGPVGDECTVRLGDDQGHLRVGTEQWLQRFAVKMIRVIVARRGDIHEVQSFRSHDDRRHAHVRFVRLRVLAGQGVRKVGVEEEVSAPPLQEEAALTEPPEAKALALLRRSGDVGEEVVIALDRFDHRPSSLRTT